jgi:hypothetical protein
LGVRQRHPTQEARQVAVAARPEQQAHTVAGHGLGQDPLERLVIAVVGEDRQAGVGAD